MASQIPPDPNNAGPIRRAGTIEKLAKKARTLTIGSKHAAEEVPKEEDVKQMSYPIYFLRWDERLKPFLGKKFPELKARYEKRHVSGDRYWFAIPASLTEEAVENLKVEIGKLKDKKPTKEKRADSPERQRGA